MLTGNNISPLKLLKIIAKILNLTKEQCEETLPSGIETTVHNRVSWAISDLYHAGLLFRPARGYYKISPAGLDLLKNAPTELTRKYLMQYPSYQEYMNKSEEPVSIIEEPISCADDPETRFQCALDEINNKLKKDIIDELKNVDPVHFERIILDLFEAMHYGVGNMTSRSHDGGIDGIIDEDALGLSKIYMQAKRYSDNRVNEKEIQNFVGALACDTTHKGVFVTTSFFDERARKKAEDASKKDIVVKLIDGQKLAELLIEYGIGVRTNKTIKIQAVDICYFKEED